MEGMFYRARSFAGDISTWDTSNVADMSSMFAAAISYGDLSKWDTSSVIDMGGMFSGDTFFNGDLSN